MLTYVGYVGYVGNVHLCVCVCASVGTRGCGQEKLEKVRTIEH